MGEVRLRKLTAVQRWRALDKKIRGLEADIHSRNQHLAAVNRALERAKKEAADVARFGSDDDADLAIAAAASEEQAELEEELRVQGKIVDGLQAQLVLARGEMKGIDLNVQRMTTTAEQKEDELKRMRLKVGKMAAARRDTRRDQKTANEAAVLTCGTALQVRFKSRTSKDCGGCGGCGDCGGCSWL